MLNTILEKKELAEKVYFYKIKNNDIAAARKPGQFVIIRLNESGERIPLTIVNSNTNEGWFSIVFQVVGKTTALLANLNQGEVILDIAGPLGSPTKTEYHGNCVMIGGGIGIAALLPIAKAFAQEGNRIVSILGARSSEFLILEEEIRKCSDVVKIVTDNGIYGRKGFVTDELSDILKKQKIQFVFAVGPVGMMKAVCDITKNYNIQTMVSLNPIMIDGTGMCGACRCNIKGETKLACVHGPEFNGHEVDFELLIQRLKMFKDKEKHA